MFGDRCVADVSWLTCPVCLVTEVCGRCVLVEVSHVFGDRLRRCGRCVFVEVSGAPAT